MNILSTSCIFREELSSPPYEGCPQAIDLGYYAELAQRGKAKLIPQGTSVSVSVKVSEQGNLKRLPCGARTLLVDPKTGTIRVRGVNKFFDYDEVDAQWAEDASIWAHYQAFCQRKLAGFVVTLYSLDGITLEVMSKHVCSGHHVEIAKECLQSMLSPSQQSKLSSDLFRLRLSASLECIDPRHDFGHPVLESSRFHQQLVLFSLQKVDSIREYALEYEKVRELADHWGLPCVDTVSLPDKKTMHHYIQSTYPWRTNDVEPFDEVAEGFVLLLQVPQYTVGEHCCTPIRLKVKTTRYVTLRSLRSCILGESKIKLSLYHEAFLMWYVQQGGTRETLLQGIQQRGIDALSREFEQYCMDRKRERDTLSLSEHFEKVLTWTERQLHTDGAPLVTILLCGLPGSGKSTLSNALMEYFTQHQPQPFQYGVVLSKDLVHVEVAHRHAITEASSNHKKRHLRTLLHKEMLSALRDVSVLCSCTQYRTLLIIDACNATEEARRTWLHCLPTCSYALTVYLDCPSDSVLADRVKLRQDHPLIKSSEEGDQALRTVQRIFSPPSKDGSLWLNSTLPTTELVKLVRDRVVVHLPSEAPPTPPAMIALSPRDVADRLRSFCDDRVGQLLRLPPDHSLLQPLLAPTVRGREKVVYAAVLSSSDGETLWSSARTVLADLIGETDSGDSALARVWNTVKDKLLGNPGPIKGEVVQGHTQWLRGWLFQQQNSKTEVKSIREALNSRFHRPPVPHITLYYGNEDDTSTFFFEPSHYRVGDTVECVLEELLVDRFAMCFRARLGDREVQWGPKEKETVPLHFTVGLTDRTAASYAGSMLASFQQWELENEALRQQMQTNRAKRSRSKYHNFVRLRLNPPIVVKATVKPL